MKMEKVSNLLYSVGAAIVIFGAWAKIEHKSFSGVMLTIGLLMEAGLFLYMGITDWFSRREKSPTVAMDKIIYESKSSSAPDNKELTVAVEKLNQTISNIFKTA